MRQLSCRILSHQNKKLLDSWHSDGSFFRTLPPVCTQLYCVTAPSPQHSAGMLRLPCGATPFDSSATGFLDGRVAYDLLSPERKRACEQLIVRYHPAVADRIRSKGLRISSNGLRLVRSEDAEDEAGTGNHLFDVK